MSKSFPFDELQERLGRIHLAQRLGIQADSASATTGPGRTRFHLENAGWMILLLRLALGVTLLRRRGQRNALDIRVKRNRVCLPDLPPPLDGFAILQLSDLHLDAPQDICEPLIRRLPQLEYDLCVITGDFRYATTGPYDLCAERMARLMEHLRRPVFGVLGNHDFVEMVPEFEALGLSVLVNEATALRHNGVPLHLVGVDDTHFYLADNLEKALSRVPAGETTVLLSHSPELYREAAYCGVDLMLSGHTHAGQVCLPGGWPLLLNASCPRRVGAGPWFHRQLVGYTAAGTGSSGLQVRFNCPPEVTLHRLCRE